MSKCPSTTGRLELNGGENTSISGCEYGRECPLCGDTQPSVEVDTPYYCVMWCINHPARCATPATSLRVATASGSSGQ
jgi:hypothetical protein